MARMTRAHIAALRKRLAGPLDGSEPLTEIGDTLPASPSAIAELHDLYLFVLAFPRSVAEHRIATDGLQRLALAIEERARTSERHYHGLYNSGIAGTTACAHFGVDLVRWLLTRTDVQVAFDSFAGDGELVRSFLATTASPGEREAAEDPRMDAAALLERLAPEAPLRYLVEQVDGTSEDPGMRNLLWTMLTPYIVVDGNEGQLSRTFARGPVPSIVPWSQGLRRSVDVAAIIDTPLPRAMRLTPASRNQLVAASRGALLGHLRETDTITYTDEGLIELFDMGQGVHMMLAPLPFKHRTTYDAYVGSVIFSHGVPIAYGGAWLFPGKTKVGINVFPAFRGGPSLFLFAQMLRCYAQRYRVGRFEADNYQLGHGNADGIRSGAYWFYHRAGFRTSSTELRAVEAAEVSMIQERPRYRTPPSVLRKLVAEPMVLERDGMYAHDIEPIDLGALVLAHVSAHASKQPRAQACTKLVMDAIGIMDLKRWNDDERAALELLAPSFCLIEDLARWSRREKNALIDIVRAKAERTEDRYIERLAAHDRLLRSWQRSLHDIDT